MKKILCLALLTVPFIFGKASAQLIVNGSFENNTAACNPNITNEVFNSKVQGVYAFGAASNLDILRDTCGYGNAYEGRYYVGIAVDLNGRRDALSLSLAAPLSIGGTYKLSYYVRKNAGYAAAAYTLSGSIDSASAGTITIANVPAPTDTNWQLKEYIFLASVGVRYIAIEATITVADITGRIVRSLTASRENNIPINVERLAAGSYIIQVYNSKAGASQYLLISK